MLDIKYIRENQEKVKETCNARQVACDIDKILQLDQNTKDILPKKESWRAEQRKLGKDEKMS